MKILSKLTLTTSILLLLTTITATWLTIDTYQRHGWSWEVTTIINGQNETRHETIGNYMLIVAFLWLLTTVNIANYREFRRLHSEMNSPPKNTK